MQAHPQSVSAGASPSSLFEERPISLQPQADGHDILPEQKLQQALDAERSTHPTALASRGTKRGRKPQDPNQIIVRATCSSQQDFERHFRAFLDDSYDRHHVLFEGTFPVSAAFLVDYGPAAAGKAKSNSYKYGPAFAPGLGSNKDGHFARSMSVMEALAHNPEDSKERMRKQRAVARAVENLVENVDGFRYAFHNEWLARDNDAYRFSYFCNDSLLNKDRTMGGVKQNDAGKVKRARKQVYDCQGYLTVKFSATRQCLEVLYKHIPLHMTYDERAPLPRVGTKRFQILEMSNPDHELVRRAREVEARKRLATTGLTEPRKRRLSAGASSPITGESDTTKRSSDAALSNVASRVALEGKRHFQFHNRTLAGETAKRGGEAVPETPPPPPPAATQTHGRVQSEAIARDANEVADLKAKLAQAEMHIQRLQQTQTSPPPGFAFAPGSPWHPPYGGSLAPMAHMLPSPTPGGRPQASTQAAQGSGQLSVRRWQGANEADSDADPAQPLFQVMQFKPPGQKRKRASNKRAAEDVKRLAAQEQQQQGQAPL